MYLTTDNVINTYIHIPTLTRLVTHTNLKYKYNSMSKKILFDNNGEFTRVHQDELTLDDISIDYGNHRIISSYGMSVNPVIYGKLNRRYVKSQVGDDFDKLFPEDTDFSNLNIRFYNNKTMNPYILTSIALGCTNGDEDSLNAVYRSENTDVTFVRELKEFFSKFTPDE